MMQYMNYYGSVHYNDEDQIFHGKIAFIHALVTYEGKDVQGLRQVFAEAVDDYLHLCQEEGLEPEQTFKGNFHVTTGITLHKRAALFAQEQGIQLDNVIIEAVDQYLTTHQA